MCFFVGIVFGLTYSGGWQTYKADICKKGLDKLAAKYRVEEIEMRDVPEKIPVKAIADYVPEK